MIGARRLALARRLLVRAAHATASQTSSTPSPAKSSLQSAHSHLQSKFKNELEMKRLNTVFDAIDTLEWRAESLHGATLFAVTDIINKSSDLKALSDRQLAVLIMGYGERCPSLSRQKRQALLNTLLGCLKKDGIILKTQARNALLAVRLDNNETLSAVTELQEWEEVGLTPNADTLTSIARIYARNGNTKGVVDIVQHMNSIGIVPSEAVIQMMIFAIARTGNYDQALSAAKNFFGSMNEVGLRCSIASAAAARKDVDGAVELLAQIPASARPSTLENNKMILNVLFELVDAKVSNAVEKVLPYLTTTPDGSTLIEWHNNSGVVHRARRGLSEDELESSLAIYSIIHPSYKNSFVERKFIEVFKDHLVQPSFDLSQAKDIAAKFENIGIVSDHQLFLLEATAPTHHVKNVVSQIDSERLHSYMDEERHPGLKRNVARGLSQLLVKTPLTIREKAEILAVIATVLFVSPSSNFAEQASIMYKLCGRDVELVIPTLGLIDNYIIKKSFASAIVQQILQNKDDPLQLDKLYKLLDSGAVECISCNAFIYQLSHMLLNRKHKEGPEDAEQLELAARLIALEFPVRKSENENLSGPKLISSIFVNEALSQARAVTLVNSFAKEPRIRLSSTQLAFVKKILNESKQEEKAELMSKLKRRNEVYSRWLQSPVTQLEDELLRMKESGTASQGAIDAIQDVILKKLAEEEPMNYATSIRHLSEIKALETIPNELRLSANALFTKCLRNALKSGNMDIAHAIWVSKIQFSADSALGYIATMYLNDKIDAADAACEELRASAQTIAAGSLRSAGRIVEDASADKIQLLSSYLSSKFNLASRVVLNLVTEIKSKQLKNLIESKELDAAFNLACEHSNATGRAFGQHELFAASFENDDGDLTRKVYNMVLNLHDKNNAVLDLAYAFLMNGFENHAAKLLKSNGLSISSGKLEFFVSTAVRQKKPEVLHGLFTGLNQSHAASTVDLNHLLLQLTRLYYKANNFDALLELEAECAKTSFPLEQKVRAAFNNLHQDSSVSAVAASH